MYNKFIILALTSFIIVFTSCNLLFPEEDNSEDLSLALLAILAGSNTTNTNNDSNANSDSTNVANPSISPGAGTYGEPQNITLTSNTTGATIRYAIGSTPTCSSGTVYSAAFNLGTVGDPATSRTVNAIACKDGLTQSSVISSAYLIQEEICDDGFDNDNDGLTDAGDADCP
ncbi:MAG: hypothetical protein GW938_10565 [Leptospira sp.]|nr:hypothetical protein [Leptospira sp.]NCS93027.1 hypothetical protein [Leptospira sp.]